MTAPAAIHRNRLADERFGVLGTINSDGSPHLVPVVFAVVGDHIVAPVDAIKPKRTTRLRRVRNLEERPRACLLVDHRSEDWSELWWVRADLRYVGDATDDEAAALRERFPQYEPDDALTAVLRLRIEGITGWSAS